MTPQSFLMLLVVGGGLVAAVAVLHKLWRGLTVLFEAVAALAVVLIAVWWAGKAVCLVVKAVVTHPRSALGLVVAVVALSWWGWLPVSAAVSVAGVAVVVWWWRDRLSYERWVGRRLRSWWLRWAVYARRLPYWLRACGLTARDPEQHTVLVMSPVGGAGCVASCGRGRIRCPGCSGSAPGRRGTRCGCSSSRGRSRRTSTRRHASCIKLPNGDIRIRRAEYERWLDSHEEAA